MWKLSISVSSSNILFLSKTWRCSVSCPRKETRTCSHSTSWQQRTETFCLIKIVLEWIKYLTINPCSSEDVFRTVWVFNKTAAVFSFFCCFLFEADSFGFVMFGFLIFRVGNVFMLNPPWNYNQQDVTATLMMHECKLQPCRSQSHKFDLFFFTFFVFVSIKWRSFVPLCFLTCLHCF